MRTRVKICGLSRAEDAAVAIACGADALGLIFFPPSPRAVDLNQAASLAASVPALVDLVGVFVDPTEAEVAAVLDRVPLTLLQFHGDETREQCEAYGTPYIKAVRMRDEVQLETLGDQHPNARAFLLDTYHPKAVGGTGAAFDWTRARIELSAPVILAGGLEA
ncbi:MAG TPA: N-(5'-phosphoribosyl)anthranilate isomerase, partial [Gammaproteobacteria bacterium]|nr:N-(5'-phosphoribosyl)anthranilate isomerase [Gammaproteobacteria bacterium]